VKFFFITVVGALNFAVKPRSLDMAHSEIFDVPMKFCCPGVGALLKVEPLILKKKAIHLKNLNKVCPIR
jgi:hypothetical protein